MAESQVHFRQDGSILLGRNPDIGFNPSDSQIEKTNAQTREFQAVIDAENRNDAYAPEIQLIESYFEGHGLPIDPLRIVTRETADRAYAAAGVQHAGERGEEGRNVYGRAYVIESEEVMKLAGRDIILGLGLHEAAHSLGEETKHLVVTHQETQSNALGNPYTFTRLGGFAYAGYNKADLRAEGTHKVTGEFWGEAFADLTRVRALREMGRSNKMTGFLKRVDYDDGLVINVLAKNNVMPLVNPEDGAIAMPAEYALIARTLLPQGRSVTGTSACNFAAFGLDLLEQRLPGLYDTMLAGLTDPEAHASFIRQVESVRPGLYRELSTLQYDDAGFSAGLLTIADALGVKDSDIKG